MTTIAHAPTTCDAEDRLRQAAFAFTNMLGDGRFDLGELRRLLKPAECDDHKPAGSERGAISVKTSSSPLSLDPHDSYYRAPYTGRD
jgi:hypothetical protein